MYELAKGSALLKIYSNKVKHKCGVGTDVSISESFEMITQERLVICRSLFEKEK